MMIIEKKSIQSNILKIEKNAQITMDQDMNVPDTKPDVEKIAESRGEIHINEIEVLSDRIRVQGTFLVEILYLSAGSVKKICKMEHQYNIDETINIEGTVPDDHVAVEASLEDLSIHIINSRKCGFRSVILFHVTVSETKFVQCSTGVNGKDHVECLYRAIPITEILINKKDIQRIKADVELPTGKPNIKDILWSSMQLRDVDTKMLDGKIAVRGSLFLFVLYEGEEEKEMIQYYDWEIPFSNELECSDSKEGLIGDISIALGNRQITIKADSDGETRNLEVEAVLELNLKAFQEYQLKYLKDMYANNRKLNLKMKPIVMENLTFQNKARNKINYRLKDEELKKLMQILNVEGEIHIEDYHKEDQGIMTEGLIFAKMMYIAGDDSAPVKSKEVIIPFEFMVEAQKVEDLERCEIKSVLEQIGGYVIDGNEVEIRATAGIYITGYSKKQLPMIDEVEEISYTEEELTQIPSITGYIVKKGDTLWNVAKQFGTTIDKIREYNEDIGDELEEKQKLFLVKKMEFMY